MRGILKKSSAKKARACSAGANLPTDNSSLGNTAKASEPFMRQVFIQRGANCADEQAFERKLYVIRKRAHDRYPRGESR